MHRPPLLTTLTVTTLLVSLWSPPPLPPMQVQTGDAAKTALASPNPSHLLLFTVWYWRCSLDTYTAWGNKPGANTNRWKKGRRSDRRQSVDWLVQCQSFVPPQWPSQMQEMGLSHCGGGASSPVVREQRGSEIDTAIKRTSAAQALTGIVHKQITSDYHLENNWPACKVTSLRHFCVFIGWNISFTG